MGQDTGEAADICADLEAAADMVTVPVLGGEVSMADTADPFWLNVWGVLPPLGCAAMDASRPPAHASTAALPSPWFTSWSGRPP